MPAPNYEGERIAGLLVAELGMTGSDTIACGPEQLALAARELLRRGELRSGTAAVVSTPLTPRELARLAAETLAEARKTVAHAETAHALVAVAEGYRSLGAVVASSMAMQPEPEGTNS